MLHWFEDMYLKNYMARKDLDTDQAQEEDSDDHNSCNLSLHSSRERKYYVLVKKWSNISKRSLLSNLFFDIQIQRV